MFQLLRQVKDSAHLTIKYLYSRLGSQKLLLLILWLFSNLGFLLLYMNMDQLQETNQLLHSYIPHSNCLLKPLYIRRGSKSQYCWKQEQVQYPKELVRGEYQSFWWWRMYRWREYWWWRAADRWWDRRTRRSTDDKWEDEVIYWGT